MVYIQWHITQSTKGTSESVLIRWMNQQPIIQSELSQKEKKKYHILTHIYGICKMILMNHFQGRNGDTDKENGLMDTVEVGEEGEVGCVERVTWKHTLPYIK